MCRFLREPPGFSLSGVSNTSGFSNSSWKCRKKNVRSNVRMCDPSTSASVMMMMRW